MLLSYRGYVWDPLSLRAGSKWARRRSPARRPCNVVSYGLSEGEANEAGIKLDARAALKYLIQHKLIDANRLVVYGQSLGGAVAIDLVASHPDVV